MPPNQTPEPREVWCHEHLRPVGPDGRCALCVHAEEPARSEQRVVLIVVAIALIGGIGPAAYYFFWANHTEERRLAAKDDEDTAKASKGRPMLAKRERWVDEVKPSTGVVDKRDILPRARPRKLHFKRRVRRGGARAMRAMRAMQSKRAKRATPSSGRHVSITMYMAHW